ncbi:Glycosyl transferase OS=Flavobacterium sp. F52 GN=FF52_07824 PE=4 SV=1: Glycos_transf_2: Methyltransf_21 [Gemmata massiliana]|uniref:Glycosyltransferase 2-like domain-containing protein n=1 Tax=Gemmata massiliana TaxID=1210884 RepID=A0A6P2D314_9BACT|nr:glycosyltransferase [Gemmata massiliana]VTR95483.1 Glycosyl transferase OS=Flavobacterium sp. F52 GN=FF52_07824 PE=4 SV=1: Glycos_transf_2: Methyltransf_21 [Gemmata massiliana]
MPAISVIMPVFNGAPFLDRALASIRAQTLIDWELVAVDDASRDESVRVLDTLAAADARVRVLQHSTNQGQAATRNTALRAAHGELVAYLDQDDEFYPDHLARAWSLRDRGDVLVFRYDLVEERPGHPALGTATTYDPGARARAMFDETITVPLGVVHRRALLDRSGLFDESLGKYRGEDEDGDLWRRFVRAGAKFVYVPQRSGRYHVRADSFARVRPPAPRPSVELATVEIVTPTGRHALWLPAQEAESVRRLFGHHEFALDPVWLRRPPIVWDVGAGAGAFTLYAKLVYDPNAVVHCFESHRASLDVLRVNVASLGRVAIHPIGLGRTNGAAAHPAASEHSPAHGAHSHQGSGPTGHVMIRDAGHVWDELGADEIDVLNLSAAGNGTDVLEALGARRNRVRVVLIESHSPGDRRRLGELLPGHTPFATSAHSPRAGVVKYVRTDVAGRPSARLE